MTTASGQQVTAGDLSENDIYALRCVSEGRRISAGAWSRLFEKGLVDIDLNAPDDQIIIDILTPDGEQMIALIDTHDNQPTIRCRCCGSKMDAQFQPALMADREGYWLVTCWQAGCGMQKYTFSDRSYATIDLAVYMPARKLVATAEVA